MNRHLHPILLSIVSLVVSSVAFADAETLRFSGQENSRTPVFTVDGPWTLDWSTRSEFPLLANFEMRLLDGASRKFIGTIAQLEGTGRGFKLFENAGTYRLEIVASNVNWELEISEVSQEQAGEMKRATDGRPSLQDASRQALRRVRESSFVEWRAIDDKTLLLFDDKSHGWRVLFSPECPGMASATVISFVAPVKNADNQYDSILLDDGTRCYFDRVSPMAEE